MSEHFVVRLEGGKPWGFALQGGADFRSPLRIGKVTPGGKAATAGLVAGDFILTINDTPWEGLKHFEAQQLIVSATDHLGLKCTKHLPGAVMQAPRTPQTPSSASFSYTGPQVPPSPTAPTTQVGAAPTVPAPQRVAAPAPVVLDTSLSKPPPPPTLKKPPLPGGVVVVLPKPSVEEIIVLSKDTGPSQTSNAPVDTAASVQPGEEEDGKVTGEENSEASPKVTTPIAPLATPPAVDAAKAGSQGAELPLDKKETLDAMMSHIEDLVSDLVVGPPAPSTPPAPSSTPPAPSTPTPAPSSTPPAPSTPTPAPSSTPPAPSTPTPAPSLTPLKANAVNEKTELAASAMVTKEPGWYKQMLQNIHRTSGDEVFSEDPQVEYDERGLKVRKSSLPRETTEVSKTTRPPSVTTPTSTRPPSVTTPTSARTSSFSSSHAPTPAPPKTKTTPTATPTVPPGGPVTKQTVVAASRKPSAIKSSNAQVEHSKDFWKQKEEMGANMEAQKVPTHKPPSGLSKTMHPLLASETPQEEQMKSVSPEQQQQQAGPGPVFDRIEAEKLNKALESSQLMAKLEKEGVPSTMVAAVVTNQKAPAEDKQLVKEKKLPPPPAKKAQALYTFEAKSTKELSFKKGDIVDLTHTVDANWLEGRFEGRKGIFPRAYVKVIQDDEIHEVAELKAEISAQFGIAKYDFNGQTVKELSFAKGDIITILRRVDDNWSEGTVNDKKGIFPIVYVEIVEEGGPSPS